MNFKALLLLLTLPSTVFANSNLNNNWSCAAGEQVGLYDCVQKTPKSKAIATVEAPLSSSSEVISLRNDFWQDDWVPDATKICGGHYQAIDISKLKLNPEVLTIEADRSEISAGKDSSLSGNVLIAKGEKLLAAEAAKLVRDKDGNIEKIYAENNVIELEPNLRLSTGALVFNLRDDVISLNQADYRMYRRNARGSAASIDVFSDNIVLKDGNYTTCAPDTNTWRINASELKLNKNNGRGEAMHARLLVHGVPILYAPYFNFPIDARRKTGFLFPELATSERLGISMAVPFYWNLAPNYDWLITPRAYSKRGLEWDNEFRYLSTDSHGKIHLVVLPSDREYRSFRRKNRGSHPNIPDNDPRVTGLDGGNMRAGLSVIHDTNTYYGLQNFINYNYVSDDNYFLDFSGNLADASTTQLLQQAGVNFNSNAWSVGFNLTSYQVLHPYPGPIGIEPYRLLPQITVESLTPEKIFGTFARFDAEFVNFEHNRDPILGTRFTTGQRMRLRPSLSWPWIEPGYYVIPKLQYDYTLYNLTPSIAREQSGKTNHIERSVPLLSLDTGMHLERDILFMHQPWVQTLEPRLYYLYVPYTNQSDIPNFDSGLYTFSFQQLFRENRFSGGDRIGDANSLALAISSRLLEPASHDEKLTIGLGNVIHFDNRRVTLCDAKLDANCLLKEQPEALDNHSSVIGFFDYHLTKDWRFEADTDIDFESGHTNKQNFRLQYMPNKRSIVNLEYQYFRIDPAQLLEDIDRPVALRQSILSFAWPLNRKLRAVGNWNYDWYNHRAITLVAGLEWEGCCTAVRLVGRRFLEPNAGALSGIEANQYDTGVYFQFVFKGLASIGNKRVDRSLEQWVNGYKTLFR